MCGELLILPKSIIRHRQETESPRCPDGRRFLFSFGRRKRKFPFTFYVLFELRSRPIELIDPDFVALENKGMEAVLALRMRLPLHSCACRNDNATGLLVLERNRKVFMTMHHKVESTTAEVEEAPAFFEN